MSCAIPLSFYEDLLPGPDSIRLLRLLPSEDENAVIECQLLNYSLQASGKRSDLYEALSYVWGHSDKDRSILLGGCCFNVTDNLHAALLHLRNRSIERIIWIDAICINQGNKIEKGQQIGFMAKIYGQATRVIVWLGEAADNSTEALDEIRFAGGKKPKNLSNKESMQEAIPALFHRPWFRRIWVLQEVATARHVLIICGPAEIDGYAFCLGVDSLKGFYQAYVDLQSLSLIRSVAYLIRGAIFRPNYIASRPSRVSQDICSLGELVDMYHTHEATERVDKVYALLGMSTNDASKANLSPNYSVPWKDLFKRLIKFLLCEKISVETWGDKEMAVIKSKGYILGKVSSVQVGIAWTGGQGLDIIFNNISKRSEYRGKRSSHWTLHSSAKSIQAGDLICLLQGASKPTIIRLCKDYFTVIMIAATPLENTETESDDTKWLDLLQSENIFLRDLLLVWDWERIQGKLQDQKHEIMINCKVPEHLDTELEDHLDVVTRPWNVTLILEDIEEHEKAKEWFEKAIISLKRGIGEEHSHTLKSQYGQTPLSWAAGNGYNALVKLLLTKDGISPDLKDNPSGQTPLSWAAQRGHEAVVKLLLETGKVDVDSKDEDGWTPLLKAAGGGHEAVVKQLLETGKVDVDSKDANGQTPLWKAAGGGHEAVVKLLLETGKVDVDSKDAKYGETPLSRATWGGHEAVVKLLLETGKVDVDSKDRYGWTPLERAARRGHEAVVKLLQ